MGRLRIQRNAKVLKSKKPAGAVYSHTFVSMRLLASFFVTSPIQLIFTVSGTGPYLFMKFRTPEGLVNMISSKDLNRKSGKFSGITFLYAMGAVTLAPIFFSPLVRPLSDRSERGKNIFLSFEFIFLNSSSN